MKDWELRRDANSITLGLDNYIIIILRSNRLSIIQIICTCSGFMLTHLFLPNMACSSEGDGNSHVSAPPLNHS